MSKINKSIASDYMKQLKLISIIFFIIRDTTHKFSDQDRRHHKYCLKGAQRYLLILQGLRKEYTSTGMLHATEYSLSYWQTMKDTIMNTRKTANLDKYLSDLETKFIQ